MPPVCGVEACAKYKVEHAGISGRICSFFFFFLRPALPVENSVSFEASAR